MSIPEKDKARPVKILWWETADLHVVFADTNEEVVYKDVCIVRQNTHLKADKRVVESEIVPMAATGDRA